MTENRKPPEQVSPAKVTVRDVGHAPYIFFDGAPSAGFANGVVNITLAAVRDLMENSATTKDLVAVAFLRCDLPAAVQLRDALNAALLLAAKPEGGAQ